MWFKLKPHMYWMVDNVAGMRFNHDDNNAFSWLKYSTKPYEAIFDSGTSLTMVPEEIFELLIGKMWKYTADGGVDW